MTKFNQRGQTLIFVLLIMVIALGVGISISSRTISTVRRTTNIDSSSRALAAAEAGVESYLSKSVSTLDTLAGAAGCTSQSTPQNYTVAGTDGISTTAEVVIGRYGCVTAAGDPYIYNLERDRVLELKTAGSTFPLELNICFSSPASGDSSSLYYLLISGTPNYTVRKTGYNQGLSATGNNFISLPSIGGKSCFALTIPSDSQLLRLQSLYNSSTITVGANTGSLRYQGFTITSTATIGTTGATVAGAEDRVKRTVRATRSLPYLPAAFNFAIFSDSDSQVFQ